MSSSERDRGSWLQVRMSDEEKLTLAKLAEEYDVSISALVRLMIAYVDEKHPVLSLRFGPKADAPTQELAGAM